MACQVVMRCGAAVVQYQNLRSKTYQEAIPIPLVLSPEKAGHRLRAALWAHQPLSQLLFYLPNPHPIAENDDSARTIASVMDSGRYEMFRNFFTSLIFFGKHGGTVQAPIPSRAGFTYSYIG